MQAAKCSADVKRDRVCSKWAAASCVLTLRRSACSPAWAGCFSGTAMGWEVRALLSSLEIWRWVLFRDYSSPEALESPSWLTAMLKNMSWLHTFSSLRLRLISCKVFFSFHFAMSFSKISLCPPSLFFLIVCSPWLHCLTSSGPEQSACMHNTTGCFH